MSEILYDLAVAYDELGNALGSVSLEGTGWTLTQGCFVNSDDITIKITATGRNCSLQLEINGVVCPIKMTTTDVVVRDTIILPAGKVAISPKS